MGFGGGSTPSIKPNPRPPTLNDPAVEQAALDQRELERRRRGFKSTILTGSQGITEGAPVARKTLLGQ